MEIFDELLELLDELAHSDQDRELRIAMALRVALSAGVYEGLVPLDLAELLVARIESALGGEEDLDA